MKVSVIVPLYNTGQRLRELIASLDRQTMPASDFETILVDDGSTDDTQQIAEELAATRRNVVVRAIPNSGWPGRPRNVGIDSARGDYVFFSDHDDLFGPRALERMVTMADQNTSDIVYGKVVRIGRSTPYWSVWRADVAVADLTGPVVTSRTVHKLYRRSFLLEHELRFREGRVRLEDHEFMAHALPHAKVVSVLASEPCYYWVQRNDDSNSSSTAVEDDVYWGFYSEVLQVWQDNAGPGPLLDAARVSSMVQAFARFNPRSFRSRSPERQQSLFDALSRLVRDHFPPELDARIPVLKRLAVQALRDEDIDRFRTLMDFRGTISVQMNTTSIEQVEHSVRVQLQASLARRSHDSSARPDVGDGRIGLPLPASLNADPKARELLPEDSGELEVTIRNRHTGVEWPVVAQTSVQDPSDTLVARVDAQIDMVRDAFGTPLGSGIWDVLVRVQFLGYGSIRKVNVTDGTLPGGAGLIAGAYVTAAVHLAFKVPEARPFADEVSWDGGHLTIHITGTRGTDLEVGVRESTETTTEWVTDGVATADLAACPVGTIMDFWITDNDGRRVRLAYRGLDVHVIDSNRRLIAYATAHGSLSVRATRTTGARSSPVAVQIRGVAAGIKRRASRRK